MGGQYGVQETTDLLDLGFSSFVVGKDILADGKFNLLEFVKLVPLVPKVVRALDGAVLIPKELGELDADDQAKLIAYIASRLPDVTDSNTLAGLVSAYLEALVAVVKAVQLTVVAKNAANVNAG